MKAIFDTKSNSGYDDEIVSRYHFPARRNYLDVARAAIGDWVVYRSPQRNGGQRAYIAAARVLRVDPDPVRAGHAYAVMRDFTPFPTPVPFAGGGTYWEADLREINDPSKVGAAVQGRAMRFLDDGDFAAIVEAGLRETLAPEKFVRLGLGVQDVDHVPFEHAVAAPAEQARRIELMLVNRKIRDANFRRLVCEAYDDRCAVTGLRIINGGGRSEVQAAHIWPVASGGPDVVQNGLALSGTVHWLFDRHLISLTDDYELLVSHNKVPAELRGLFEKQKDRIHLPADNRRWPHPAYIAKHRERFMAV